MQLQLDGKMKAAGILGILLALGMLLGGNQAQQAVKAWKQADRIVTVKGLAEREVKADLALWPLSYSVSANSLESVQSLLSKSESKIRAFLVRYGFDAKDMSSTSPQVTDNWSEYNGGSKPAERYKAQAVVVLRTAQVDLVKKIMPKTNELVKEGVLLSRSYEYQPEFLFTKLNSIKPEMIAVATKDARNAAVQFAEDSGSKVGKIRSAQQGYFSIDDLDRYTPDVKKVRVVTTVEYFLLD